MNYRPLGSTGLVVSEIGFGAWGLGGDAYGPVDDAESERALRLAWDSGVTFFDTSDLYGGGHSEEVVGAALRDVRDRAVIATKVGTLPHTGFYMPQDFSPGRIREGIEGSLRRLGTDYVDLYQLHSPPIEVIERGDDVLATLEALREQGKVRAYGISVRSPADGRRAIGQFGFRAVQANFNMIDHRAADAGLFEAAKRWNAGIVARTPLCFGYLTGTLTGGERFAGRDHRANWPREQLSRWADAPSLFAELNAGVDRSFAQLALRFCLDFREVSTVIPGMMTCAHVRENVAASALPPLTTAELTAIRHIYEGNSFYDPTIKQGATVARAA